MFGASVADNSRRKQEVDCWDCGEDFPVTVVMPKNAKKSGRFYDNWKRVRTCPYCKSKTLVWMGYTKKSGAYIVNWEGIKEQESEQEKIGFAESVGTYFSRNYRRGERVPVPEGAPGKHGDWKRWKDSRLRKIGFYDSNNMRTKGIEEDPPRYRLRENLEDSRGELSEGHLEFKAWIQDKVEQASSGEASPRFLAREERQGEREQALDTWENITMRIESILERRIVRNKDIIEGRQLSAIRKITGRIRPSFSDLKSDEFFSGADVFTKVDIGRLNIVEKIANDIARCLISHSTNSRPSHREAFWWRANLKPEDLFNLAKNEGCAVSSAEAKRSFERGFGDASGKIDRERIKIHCKRMGSSQKDLHHRRRIRITIDRLLEGGVEPPRSWIWMDVWTPGISFFPDVCNRISKHIEKDGGEALRIFDDKTTREEAGLDHPKHGLLDWEISALMSFKECGFGNTQGTKKRGRDLTEHKSLSLAYNLINEMKGAGLIRTQKMTEDQYTSYFLEGDESLKKGRGAKQYPNILVFTESMLVDVIGKSSMEDFEKGEQNAIYRWLRGETERWMYCPPNNHDRKRGRGGLLGDPRTSTNTSDYEMFEVGKRDWETGDLVIGENGEPVTARTVKCVPGESVLDAMNALQRTQWEINLDVLQVMCDFELDSGAVIGGGLESKVSRIMEIRPKEAFEKAFFVGDGNPADEERKTILEWCRRIIEHNGNVFWHSWVCDFRGRMMPRCQLLSPQKGDFSRGLIRFKHWKPLGNDGIRWLHVHVHNMMEGIEILDEDGVSVWEGGPAKKNQSFDAREGWVRSNLKQLRIVGSEPQSYLEEIGLGQRRFSKRSDFQRLAAIIELERVWSQFESSGKDWGRVTSGQPVYLDASCNGYQHVSALLRDENLAHLTNVTSSEEGVKDLYAAVADSSRRAGEGSIRKYLKSIGLGDGLSDEFVESVFHRSVAKQPTIVRVYGSKDMLKCLEGRKGQGRADKSKPLPKRLTEKELEERERIPTEFEEAYYQWVKAKRLGEPLSMSHYEKHAKKLRGKGFSKSRADKWARLLREEEGINLWAPGSGLYEAIIAPGNDLSREFCYPDGPLWKEQHSLSKMLAKTIKKGISDATKKAYDNLQKAMKDVSERCDGLWPGVVWEVMPDEEEKSFVVHQYYIEREGADKTKRGMPTQPSAAYSGLLPDWYRVGVWEGHTVPKSKNRIAIRIHELFGRSELLTSGQRRYLSAYRNELLTKKRRERTLRYDHSALENILRSVDPDHTNGDAVEIRGLMLHRDYSIPNFSSDEKVRTRGKKSKINSAMMPNFIHSLDAYHMRTVINMLNEETEKKGSHLSFWAVHDAFGTHPCDVGRMRRLVIKAFFEMHKERDLNDWTGQMKWVGRQGQTAQVPIGSLWASGADGPDYSSFLIS